MLRPTFQPVISLAQYAAKNKIPIKTTVANVKTTVAIPSEVGGNDQQIRVLTPSEIMRTLPNLDEYDCPQQNNNQAATAAAAAGTPTANALPSPSPSPTPSQAATVRASERLIIDDFLIILSFVFIN